MPSLCGVYTLHTYLFHLAIWIHQNQSPSYICMREKMKTNGKLSFQMNLCVIQKACLPACHSSYVMSLLAKKKAKVEGIISLPFNIISLITKEYFKNSYIAKILNSVWINNCKISLQMDWINEDFHSIKLYLVCSHQFIVHWSISILGNRMNIEMIMMLIEESKKRLEGKRTSALKCRK
jgi:hypothetical protein